jgi:hydrogenase expression/formation protein HypD
MKHLAEYRDGDTARRLAAGIAAVVTRPWAIMEVCGGQTHSIIRNALDQLLPPEVELIHGPGCPVCVTPLEMIDRALVIAALPKGRPRHPRTRQCFGTAAADVCISGMNLPCALSDHRQ